MSARLIDLPALSMRAELASIDTEARTVDVIFSTGAGVERYDWNTGKRYLEKLSLDAKHVRLDRLNAGAPVLDAHSAWSVGDILGAVIAGSAKADGKRGVAKLQFSKRDSVTDIWRDIVDGIIRCVSNGYRVYKFEEDASPSNKLPVRTAIDWEPFEISMVPMPADIGAHVRNRDKANTNSCVLVRNISDADRGRFLRLAQLAS